MPPGHGIESHRKEIVVRSGFALAMLSLSLFAVGCRTTQQYTNDATAFDNRGVHCFIV